MWLVAVCKEHFESRSGHFCSLCNLSVHSASYIHLVCADGRLFFLEIIDEFLTEIDVNKIIKESTTGGSPTDDGPPTFYRGFNDYKKNVTNWIDDMYAGAGWKILNYILGRGALNPDYDYTLEYNVVPAVAYGRKQSGEYGTRFGVDNPIQSYKNYIESTVLKNLGYTLLKWIGITPDGNSYTGVEVETPVLPGVGMDNVGNTTKDKLKLKENSSHCSSILF